MALTRPLSRMANWGNNGNATGREVPDKHPLFPELPVGLENTLVDGQRPSWDSASNERSDFQTGSAPGSPFGFEFGIRVDEMPTMDLGASWRWWLVGPEIHNNGSTGQALFMWEIDGLGRWRVNANGGASSPYYLRVPDAQGNPTATEWRKPVVVGRPEYFRVYIRPSTGSDGRIEVYDGATLVAVRQGPTINSQGPGYWKWPNYCHYSLNGRRRYTLWWPGIEDRLPPVRSSGVPENPPPPPPPSTTPVMTTAAPAPDATYTGQVPYDVRLADVPAGHTLYIGLAQGPDVAPITTEAIGSPARAFTGTLDVSDLAPGAYGFYAALHRPDGSRIDAATRAFMVNVAAPVPPPDPDPDPCADVRADLERVTGQRDELLVRLDSALADVARLTLERDDARAVGLALKARMDGAAADLRSGLVKLEG